MSLVCLLPATCHGPRYPLDTRKQHEVFLSLLALDSDVACHGR